jgi:hypothetical protein
MITTLVCNGIYYTFLVRKLPEVFSLPFYLLGKRIHQIVCAKQVYYARTIRVIKSYFFQFKISNEFL